MIGFLNYDIEQSRSAPRDTTHAILPVNTHFSFHTKMCQIQYGLAEGNPSCHFDEKKFKKKSFFERLWGENGHNSLNIKVSALKLLAFDREPNFG